MTISELMKQQRKAKEMSLADVGKQIGVDRATVQRWENGIINIDRKHISAICRVLDIDPVIFCHPNEVIFPIERQIIEAWRAADELDKALILKVLHLEEKNDSSQSAI